MSDRLFGRRVVKDLPPTGQYWPPNPNSQGRFGLAGKPGLPRVIDPCKDIPLFCVSTDVDQAVFESLKERGVVKLGDSLWDGIIRIWRGNKLLFMMVMATGSVKVDVYCKQASVDESEKRNYDALEEEPRVTEEFALVDPSSLERLANFVRGWPDG